MRQKLVTDLLTALYYNIIEMEDRIASDERFEDLTSNDMRTLSAIGTAEPKSLKQVGDYLRVRKQTAHVATNSLIKRGYAYKRSNPNDGRYTWIILTNKGLAAVNLYRSMLRENVIGMTGKMTDDQIDELIKSLAKMNGYMDGQRGEGTASSNKKK